MGIQLSSVCCKSFINAFTKATQSQTDIYVRKKTRDGKEEYVFGTIKNPSFKVNQIAEISQRCINEFSSDEEDPEPLENRLSLLKDLKSSLIICSQRIERSIKKRWWYWILNLFGYQAKVPRNIQEKIRALDHRIPQLETLLFLEKRKEEREKQSKIKKNEASDESTEKPKDIKKVDKPLPKPKKKELPLPNDKPFNFESVPDAVKKFHIYSMFSPFELAKMQLVSKLMKKSIDEYLNTNLNAFKTIKELVKTSTCFERNKKYIASLEFILTHANFQTLLTKNKIFKTEFLEHMLEFTAWKQFVDHYPTIVKIFFEHGSNKQLTKFIKDYAFKVNFEPMKYLWENEPLGNAVFSELTKERAQQILKLSLKEDDIIRALICTSADIKKIEFLLKPIYNRFPESHYWNITRSPSKGQHKILPYITAYQIMNVLTDPKCTKKQSLIKEIITSFYKDYSINYHLFKNLEENLYNILFFYFNKYEEPTIIIFLEAIFETDYISYCIEKSLAQGSKFYIPLFRTILHSQNPFDFNGDTDEIISKISLKDQAVAFIEECQKLEQPLQSFVLRRTQNDRYISECSRNCFKEVFRELGLDTNEYSPIEDEYWDKSLDIHQFCHKLNSIDNSEVIEKLLTIEISHDLLIKVLRALYSGILISVTERITTPKPKLVLEGIQNRGIDVEALSQPITINDLFQNEKDIGKILFL